MCHLPCHLADSPLHVHPATPHASAGVEDPPQDPPSRWPRLPAAPCPTLRPTLYYYYITVEQYSLVLPVNARVNTRKQGQVFVMGIYFR